MKFLETYKKNDGELNSTLSNMFADATYEMSNPLQSLVGVGSYLENVEFEALLTFSGEAKGNLIRSVSPR